MKETTIVVEAILNSSEPMSGTTVHSSPTMPPTKALMRTSSENCCQFSRKPSRMPGEPAVSDFADMVTLSDARRPGPR
jgi:hypothetical protein